MLPFISTPIMILTEVTNSPSFLGPFYFIEAVYLIFELSFFFIIIIIIIIIML
jgi:hypothetical protein